MLQIVFVFILVLALLFFFVVAPIESFSAGVDIGVGLPLVVLVLVLVLGLGLGLCVFLKETKVTLETIAALLKKHRQEFTVRIIVSPSFLVHPPLGRLFE